MEQPCERCRFVYGSVAPREVSGRVCFEAGVLADLILGANDDRLSCRKEGQWSALEYAGHVRDVLLVQRERVLMTRAERGQPVRSMTADARVEWGEYDTLTQTEVSMEIRAAARRLAHSVDLLSEVDWSRTLLYNYPVPAERSLEWLANHTLHELIHHRVDIADALGFPGA